MKEFASATKLPNGQYQNHSHWNYSQTSFKQIFNWQLNRSKTQIPLPGFKVLESTLPIIKPNFDKVELPNARLTWLGHASVLLQVGSFSVLTDPVFEQRAGPFGMFGPKRYRDCPTSVEELPKLDAIVISHNHYDHLCTTTIGKLANRFPNLKWFVPVGNGALLTGVAEANITELNWWESTKMGEFEFNCVPAMHWSKRGLFDTNKALWSGWLIKGLGGSFYFTGDTGYCPVFKAIGERFGPISISAIPVGAYEPRDIMMKQHVNRQDAVELHKDVKSLHSLGIHWGTWVLTDEDYLEPRDLSQFTMDKPFETVNHGESLVIKWTL